MQWQSCEWCLIVWYVPLPPLKHSLCAKTSKDIEITILYYIINVLYPLISRANSVIVFQALGNIHLI